MSDPTYQDVLDTRADEEFTLFAKRWLESQVTGDWSSDDHMNLLFWSSRAPVQTLAIILNLIDEAGEDPDERLGDSIPLGPIDWFLTHCPESFHSVVREAAMHHPGFALYTTWKREHPDDPASLRFGRN